MFARSIRTVPGAIVTTVDVLFTVALVVSLFMGEYRLALQLGGIIALWFAVDLAITIATPDRAGPPPRLVAESPPDPPRHLSRDQMTEHNHFTPKVTAAYERSLRSAADFVVEALNYDPSRKSHARACAQFASALENLAATFMLDLGAVARDALDVVLDEVGEVRKAPAATIVAVGAAQLENRRPDEEPPS